MSETLGDNVSKKPFKNHEGYFTLEKLTAIAQIVLLPIVIAYVMGYLFCTGYFNYYQAEWLVNEVPTTTYLVKSYYPLSSFFVVAFISYCVATFWPKNWVFTIGSILFYVCIYVLLLSIIAELTFSFRLHGIHFGFWFAETYLCAWSYVITIHLLKIAHIDIKIDKITFSLSIFGIVLTALPIILLYGYVAAQSEDQKPGLLKSWVVTKKTENKEPELFILLLTNGDRVFVLEGRTKKPTLRSLISNDVYKKISIEDLRKGYNQSSAIQMLQNNEFYIVRIISYTDIDAIYPAGDPAIDLISHFFSEHESKQLEQNIKFGQDMEEIIKNNPPDEARKKINALLGIKTKSVKPAESKSEINTPDKGGASPP